MQSLKTQLAGAEQVLLEQQQALSIAQSQMAFWTQQDAQYPELSQGDTNVPQWTQSVASNQKSIATIQAQIARLQAQIAAQ